MSHKVGVCGPDAFVHRIGALYDGVVACPAHIAGIFGGKFCGICVTQRHDIRISDHFSVFAQRPAANAPFIIQCCFLGIQVGKQADDPVRVLCVFVDQSSGPAHIVLRGDDGPVIMVAGKLSGISHDRIVVAGIKAQSGIGYICLCGGSEHPACRNFLL